MKLRITDQNGKVHHVSVAKDGTVTIPVHVTFEYGPTRVASTATFDSYITIERG